MEIFDKPSPIQVMSKEMTKEEILQLITEKNELAKKLQNELRVLNSAFNDFEVGKYKEIYEGKYCKIEIFGSCFYCKIINVFKFHFDGSGLQFEAAGFNKNGNVTTSRVVSSKIDDIEIITKEEFTKATTQYITDLSNTLLTLLKI